MDTLMSYLQPELRAFPFPAPGSVLSYTLQVVSLEIILCSFVSVPWGHAEFLATLAGINQRLWIGRGHHSYEASVCGEQAPGFAALGLVCAPADVFTSEEQKERQAQVYFLFCCPWLYRDPVWSYTRL